MNDAIAIPITDRIDALNSQAKELQNDPSQQTEQLADEALALSEEADYAKGIAEALVNLAWRDYIKGNYPAMLIKSQRSLLEAEKTSDKRLLASSLNSLGLVYESIGDNEKSLQYHLRSLANAKEIENKHGVGASLGNIGRVYMHLGESSKALEYFGRCKVVFSELNNQNALCTTISNICEVHIRLGNYTEALEGSLQNLAYYQAHNNKRGYAIQLGIIGIVYYKLGDISKSLEYQYNSLQIYEEIGDKSGSAAAFINIGNIFQGTDQPEKAIKTYEQALKISSESGNKLVEATILMNIGNTYKGIGSTEKALSYFHKTLPILEPAGDLEGISASLFNIGELYFLEENFTDAMNYLQRSLRICEKTGDKPLLTHILNNIGSIYGNTTYKDYNPQKSIKYFERSLELAEEMGVKTNKYETHKNLSDLYFRRNDWENAYIHFKKYHEIEREVYSNESAQKIANLEAQRKLAEVEKEREIERREQEATTTILNKIFPGSVVARLRNGESPLADYYSSVTVIFLDLVNFTHLASRVPARQLIYLLNSIFKSCDSVIAEYGMEKIKTIGDAYMAASGVPQQNSEHLINAARASIKLIQVLRELVVEIPPDIEGDRSWMEDFGEIQVRIGLHSGEAIGGVIGENKYAYDLWGDTVNIAARMESTGESGQVHCSEEFYMFLKNQFIFKERGNVEIKGKGIMKTYFLVKEQ